MEDMRLKSFDTKTNKAKKLISSGEWKAALSIIRTFRLDFTREQKRVIQIASDVMNGHEKFYKDIGIDVEKIVSDCQEMLLAKYKVFKS